ncbi:MAG: hypothetical protein K0R66_615 [Gammaproteobacteria bacterium]|jgi:hypothetical protein|nr:hypothetical protein [Gammaproteobacteria bacterium]
MLFLVRAPSLRYNGNFVARTADALIKLKIENIIQGQSYSIAKS